MRSLLIHRSLPGAAVAAVVAEALPIGIVTPRSASPVVQSTGDEAIRPPLRGLPPEGAAAQPCTLRGSCSRSVTTPPTGMSRIAVFPPRVSAERHERTCTLIISAKLCTGAVCTGWLFRPRSMPASCFLLGGAHSGKHRRVIVE